MTTQFPLPLDTLKRDWLDESEPKVLAIQGMFSTDSLHDILSPPEHVNHLGVLLARMKNKGLVQRVGYQPSRRPESNGRVIGVWCVVRPIV